MKRPFISKISLRNFKCYKHLDLELQPGVNILYGVNGTGKTSIVEGITIAAGSFLISFSSVEKRNIKSSEIRIEYKEGMPSPEYQFPVQIIAEGCVLENNIEWSRELKSISGRITMENARKISKLSDKAALDVQNGVSIELPIITYFSTQRLFTDRKESDKNPIGRFAGYYNALNATNTRKHIQKWFEDAEYEQYQKRQSNPAFTNYGLEGIRELVLKYFEEDWTRIYYYKSKSNKLSDKGLYIDHKDGKIISESLLSDGYRNFLWLLIEIAWRCYTLNPFLGKDAFSKTTGIVMIDEVDLHLHPKWQQRIVPILAEAFPNIQFVITTHSPIILSSVKGNVLRLEGDKVYVQENLYGLKPSQVLEGFMQIHERLPQFMGDIQTYFALINQEKGKSSEALGLREKLEKEISQNDPLFTEADALINFYSY